MTKLSPEAEQALDVAAARHALQTLPESSDLLDKVRAMELAIKRRRMPLSLLLGCALAFGCAAPEPPRYFSVDSDFGEGERETIHATVDAWCDAVGWCPEEALWSDRGRVMLVDHLPHDEETRSACPDGLTCGVFGRNDGDVVRIARDRIEPDNMAVLFVITAHEIGHFCTEHTTAGLMAAVQTHASEPVIDAEAAEAWRSGCHVTF